ncbi:MAG: RNA polymerase sigma factor [Solirubrobacterales bacterium]
MTGRGENGFLRDLGDAELVARCREGEDDAWTELVNRFSRYVCAIAVQGFRLSQEEAEDVSQEVSIRAGGHEVPVETLPESGDEDFYSRLDEAMSVRQAMTGLPEHCSEILDRFFTRDQSYRDIGAAL